MAYKDKKIAVIGVSNRPEKYGFKIFRDLLKDGYDIAGVNPTAPEVLGKETYKSLKDIKGALDLVITVVPHQVTERVVDECSQLGIKEIWMQPGSESDDAIKKAKDLGINVTHNSCFMVVNGIW